MKYLKKFNESTVDQFKSDMSDSLAYLLDDDDYITNIITVDNTMFLRIEKKYKGFVRDIMWWNDIKDHMIPFMQLVRENYSIAEFNHGKSLNPKSEHIFEEEHVSVAFYRYNGYQNNNDWYYMNIDSVIEDSDTIPEKFYEILIKLDI